MLIRTDVQCAVCTALKTVAVLGATAFITVLPMHPLLF